MSRAGGGKKPTSEKQRRANISNAQKSTGPRTDAGKNISKWNGLIHGMRAEHTVLPGEGGDEYAELLAAHVEEFSPQTPVQQLLVKRAAIAYQKLERGDRVEEALAAKLRDSAAVEGIEGDGIDLDKLTEQLASDPAETMRQLRKTPTGCRWIREQWLFFQTRLETQPGLMPSQRQLSIFLLGKRMEDVYLDDSEVSRWVVAHMGTLLGDRKGLEPADMLRNTGRPSSPMVVAELDARAKELIRSLPDARRSLVLLRGYVAEELARIDEHLALITEFSERQRALSVAASEIPLTPAGKQLTGYVANQRQSYDAALRRLAALQNPSTPCPDQAGSGPRRNRHGSSRGRLSGRRGRRTDRRLPAGSFRSGGRCDGNRGCRRDAEESGVEGTGRADVAPETPVTVEAEAAARP